MSEYVCSSSKRKITNTAGSVVFPCPGCAKQKVVRSKHMRSIGSAYTCAECGFVGP